jgi:histidinol-phosphate aminotransferase
VKPSALARSFVLSYPSYEPGRPIEDVARELGLDPAGIIKLASNENAFGPSPKAVEAARRAVGQGQLYPDGGCYALRRELSRVHGLEPGQFVIGNGSNEVIEFLGHVFLEPGDEVVMGAPDFVVYRLVTLLFGASAVEVPLVDHRIDLKGMARAITPRTRLVFVSTPSNPTGTATGEAELFEFVRCLPETVVCAVDEAYTDYAERPPDIRALIREGRNVVGMRTFSKIYGLASLRIGYGYSSPEMASLLDRVRQPFNVNAIAQAAAVAALGDLAFAQACATENRRGILRLESGFADLGLEFVPSQANFVLVRVGDGAGVFEALQRRGVIVRPLKIYNLPEWVRVTVGTAAQNERLLSELAAVVR